MPPWLHWLAYGVVTWLIVVGLYGVVTSRHLVHLVVSLSVVQSATYVLLICIGYVRGAGAPIFADVPVGTPAVDPVVQALSFTDIVVSATTVALLLSFAVTLYARTGSVDPRDLAPLRVRTRETGGAHPGARRNASGPHAGDSDE